MVRMFGIQLTDVVCFKLVDNQEDMEHKFEFSVFRVVDNMRQEKHIVSDSGNFTTNFPLM